MKFEGEKLPAILNAIETENNGQKLVLEVAVCIAVTVYLSLSAANGSSNTWVRMSSVLLLWMVSFLCPGYPIGLSAPFPSGV